MKVSFYQALLLAASVQAVSLNTIENKDSTPCPDCGDDEGPAAKAAAIYGADPENSNPVWHVKPANSALMKVKLDSCAQIDGEEEAKGDKCCEKPGCSAADALAILHPDPENHKAEWQVKPAGSGLMSVNLGGCNAEVDAEEEKKDSTPCPDCGDEPDALAKALAHYGADPENNNP